METQVIQTEAKMHYLSKVLRTIAGVVLLTAAVVFLCQGWAGMGSVDKVLTFICLIAGIGGTGIFCGVALKDDKGARVSLAVANAVIPAAFAQIGALLFSVLGGPVKGIPEIFLLKAPSISAALITLGTGAVLLLPVMYLGFSALARSRALELSAVYLIANCALLIPLRTPHPIAIIVIAVGALLMCNELFYLLKSSDMKTAEGLMCRGMLFTPLVILVERTLMLYSPDSMFYSAMFLVAGVFLFFLPTQFVEKKASLTGISQCLGSLFISASWIAFADGAFYSSLGHLFSATFYAPIVIMPTGAILFLLSLMAEGSGRGYRQAGGLICIATALVQLMSVSGIFSSFLCISTAILVVAVGISMEERGLFYSGVFGLGAGILYHVRYALDLYTLSPWLSLSLLGIITLVASSYIERNFGKLQTLSLTLRKKFASN